MLAAIAAVSQAFAVDATTTPVGYESLSVATGFNYLGLRLQAAPVVSGTLTAVTSTSVSDSSQNFGTLLTAGTTYILEIKNANGVTQEFLGSAASGSTITTPANLSGVAAVNDLYTIRAAATLNSVFGPANEAGLDTGFFGPGGDIVYIPDGLGGFGQYYYDLGQSSWADSNGTALDGGTVPIFYMDGLIISATGPKSVTVTGEVKKGATGQILPGNSFSYLSSVSPAGATLDSAFTAAVPTLNTGFFGPGGDIFYVPDGAGGFNQFYYDAGQSSWADSNGSTVDATTISLPSGIVIFNAGDTKTVLNTPPTSYSTL